MAGRDVELDLIGSDHTGAATRSAANNLDQLRAKMAKFNVDSNRNLRRGMLRTGIQAGSAFTTGFIKIISGGILGRGTLGMAAQMSPGATAAGITVGALLASKVLSTAHAAIVGGLPLILAAGILVGPFVHLVKTQKGAVEKLKGQWKGFVSFVSKPLRLPFLDTLGEVGRGLEDLKKPFAALVAGIGPALKPFTKGFFDGIVGFIDALKPAIPGITAGLQEWGRQLPIIGAAFGTAFSTILKDPAKVEAAVRKMGEVLVWVADNLPGFVAGIQTVSLALKGLIGPIGLILPGLTAMVRGGIALFWTLAISGIRSITMLVAAMAVLNPAMRPVLAGLQTLLGAAEVTFAGIKNKWAATDAAIRRRKIVAKLEANLTDLQNKVKAAQAKLKTVHGKKARAKLEAEIAQLKAQVAAAKAAIASVKGKSVTITATYVRTTVITTIRKGVSRPGAIGATPSAGDTWAGAAGGMYRTGGAAAISVAAPIVDTRVFIDGSQIRSVARSTVIDETRRNAHRARVGRR